MNPTTVRLDTEHKRRAEIIKSITGKSLSSLLGGAIDKEFRKVSKKYKVL